MAEYVLNTRNNLIKGHNKQKNYHIKTSCKYVLKVLTTTMFYEIIFRGTQGVVLRNCFSTMYYIC